MANYNWVEIFSKKSDKELVKIISTSSHYNEEIKAIARNELGKRNFDFENLDSIKENWKRESIIQNENSLFNRYYNSKYYLGCSITFIVMAIFTFFMYGNKDRPTNEENLVELSGTINSYSFQRQRGHKGFVKIYYIWLNEYQKPFQVAANYIGQDNGYNFREDLFKQNVKKNDLIKLKVYKNELDKIGSLDELV